MGSEKRDYSGWYGMICHGGGDKAMMNASKKEVVYACQGNVAAFSDIGMMVFTSFNCFLQKNIKYSVRNIKSGRETIKVLQLLLAFEFMTSCCIKL
jgi:hypothetical protein